MKSLPYRLYYSSIAAQNEYPGNRLYNEIDESHQKSRYRSFAGWL